MIPSQILSGWKDIANHLGKGVRTAQRYERELALPVRRPAGRSRCSVIATVLELDAWVTASPLQQSFAPHRKKSEMGVPLEDFRKVLEEYRRLREETAQLKRELHTAMAVLQEKLLAMQEGKFIEPATHSGVLVRFEGKLRVN